MNSDNEYKILKFLRDTYPNNNFKDLSSLLSITKSSPEQFKKMLESLQDRKHIEFKEDSKNNRTIITGNMIHGGYVSYTDKKRNIKQLWLTRATLLVSLIGALIGLYNIYKSQQDKTQPQQIKQIPLMQNDASVKK